MAGGGVNWATPTFEFCLEAHHPKWPTCGMNFGDCWTTAFGFTFPYCSVVCSHMWINGHVSCVCVRSCGLLSGYVLLYDVIFLSFFSDSFGIVCLSIKCNACI